MHYFGENMKKAILISLLLLLIGMVIISCSIDKKTSPDTEAPTVIITNPQNNSEFETGTIINVISEAEDNEEVDNVKFYIDGFNSYEDSSEPYEYIWNTTDLNGSHNIYAKATDSSDNTATSELVTVIITYEGEAPNPPSNPNPVDNALLVYINSDISWECTDPDGDPLIYDVYLGTSTNPPLMNSGQSETIFNPGTLIENTTYYWKIVAKDNHGNSTTGNIWEFTTRDDALHITPIANIQDSVSVYNGQNVTIEGVITIGAGISNNNLLNAFIQDSSGKGIMLFDYDITTAYEADLIRGNILRVSGEVDDYNGVTEIKDFTYTIISSGNPDPAATILDMGINLDIYEGTLVQVTGTIYEMYYAGGGTNLNIEDENGNQLTVRVWDSTNIDLDEFSEGNILEARGVGGMYNSNFQVQAGYQDHLTTLLFPNRNSS